MPEYIKGKVACYDIHKKKKTVDSKKLSFNISVYGIIIKDGKILLSKQWDGYDFPGGTIKIGERIEDALEREVWEETGIKVKADKLVGCFDSFFISPYKNKNLHSFTIYYTCKNIKGEISMKNIAPFEKTYIKGAEWISLNKIRKLKFYNSIRSQEFIKKALKIK